MESLRSELLTMKRELTSVSVQVHFFFFFFLFFFLCPSLLVLLSLTLMLQDEFARWAKTQRSFNKKSAELSKIIEASNAQNKALHSKGCLALALVFALARNESTY